MRRGGRIGAAKSLIGGLLGLRPIIADEDGNIVPAGNARSAAEACERVIARLWSKPRPGERARLGRMEMGTGAADGIPKRPENELRRDFDVVELIWAPATGVTGVHCGPAAWGVYRCVRDDDPLA